MNRKKKKEKNQGRKISQFRATEKDFQLSLEPGEIVVNTMELAKDLVMTFTKLAKLPHEGRANVQTLFGDVLHKNLRDGNLQTEAQLWQQMGLEISMLALTSCSVSTEVEIVQQVMKLDEQFPGAPLPPPLAVVAGTDKAQ